MCAHGGNPKYDTGGSIVSPEILRKKIQDLMMWEKLGHKMERRTGALDPCLRPWVTMNHT